MRIEPRPSPPWAIGTMPAATAAAAPPDEPPAMCSGFQGLRQGPNSWPSVVPAMPNSGEVGLADRRHAARAVAAHQAVVLGVHDVRGEAAAAGARPAGDLDQQVLDQEWHAAERPVRQGALPWRARLVEGLVRPQR